MYYVNQTRRSIWVPEPTFWNYNKGLNTNSALIISYLNQPRKSIWVPEPTFWNYNKRVNTNSALIISYLPTLPVFREVSTIKYQRAKEHPSTLQTREPKSLLWIHKLEQSSGNKKLKNTFRNLRTFIGTQEPKHFSELWNFYRNSGTWELLSELRNLNTFRNSGTFIGTQELENFYRNSGTS